MDEEEALVRFDEIVSQGDPEVIRMDLDAFLVEFFRENGCIRLAERLEEAVSLYV